MKEEIHLIAIDGIVYWLSITHKLIIKSNVSLKDALKENLGILCLNKRAFELKYEKIQTNPS